MMQHGRDTKRLRTQHSASSLKVFGALRVLLLTVESLDVCTKTVTNIRVQQILVKLTDNVRIR